MIEYNDEWIIRADDLTLLDDSRTADKVLHALCTDGSCTFRFNGEEKTLKPGSLVIVRNAGFLRNAVLSDDFKMEGIYFSPKFIELAAQRSNYTIRHILLLNADPVLELNEIERERWNRNYENIFYQLGRTDNQFRYEMMLAACWQFFLDCFDFSSRVYGNRDISMQSSSLVTEFFAMLEAGEYRAHRNIPFYADKLFVTAKHLSEVVKRVSGHSANYWITHFTVADLQRTLRTTKMTMGEISDLFNFSSVAYFTRYMQIHLGVNPSQLRE